MGSVGSGNGVLHLVGFHTGAAWLSSARAVRCWVKSRNERNPHLQLLPGYAGHSEETAGDKAGGRRGRRQVLMALTAWATHVLQWW